MHRFTLLFTSALILTAPSVSLAQSAGMVTALGKNEGQLSVIAWAGYLERGQTDKAYDWVTPFEKQTGCKVSVKVAGSSDEMVSLMNQGGYDLVTASGDASLRLVAGGKVQPINVPSSFRATPA